ncbi:MAG TPA: CheR family methyltransferase [Polyangiaceae bacterium]|jgi:chemotaxis protein methyltransferase CheR|nr:CheR family methyltransferase [Polyangiaceae bacterium]
MQSSEDIEVRLLLDAIYLRYHYDFRSYSPASLKRRLTAAKLQIGADSLSALQQKVLHDPATFTRLLQFLTVQVSDMFRDPSFFLALREKIVPELRTYPSIRVWIAGCSTGEELYSYAILLREEGLLERTTLYATDINPETLHKAELGLYPIERMQSFTENHRLAGGKSSLSEHYTAAYGSAAFDRTLRKNVVFSDHSLATDSVFAEVQLVSCRNVLIYFDRSLQDRALGLMKDALCRRGFLGLGSKESLMFSTQAPAFRDFVPGERWYQRC